MDNLNTSIFLGQEVEYSGPGLRTLQHSPSQTGSVNGLLTSQGGPGMLTSLEGPGMLTSLGGPGMVTSQGGPGMLTSQGCPGMLTSQGAPGLMTSQGGPGMHTSQGGTGMLTSTSSHSVGAMLPSPSQPVPGHVDLYNLKDGVEVVILGRELTNCYLISKVFMVIAFSG